MPIPLPRPPRTQASRGWMLAALSVVVSASPLGAAPVTQSVALVTDPTGKLSIEATGWLGLSPFCRPASGGLVPIQIRVVNGGTRDAVVAVARSESRYIYGPGAIVTPRVSFRVPAGGTVVETVYVDPLAVSDGSGGTPTINLGARTAGPRTDVDLSVGWLGTVSAASAAVPLSPDAPVAPQRVATSPRVYSSAALRLLRPVGEAWPSEAGVPEGEIDLAAAPDDWRGFTALKEIVVADEDWTTLPSGQRRALLAWVGLGGLLEMVCDDAAPERLDRLGLPRPGADGRRRVGAGEVMVVAPGEETWNALHGLGGPVAKTRPPIRQSGADWRSVGFARAAGFAARTLPFAPILAFLAVFAIVAGPINVMFLAGQGRPSRIFWTTPAIALLATAVLLALMLLRDGVGGEGSRLTLCLLDPDRNTAHVLQQQVSRTGVLLGSSFPVRETSWMRPEPAADVYDPNGWMRAAGARRTYTEAEGTRRVGDWFASRSDQAFTLQAVRASRGSLVVSGPPEAPEILSSVDAALSRVVVVDAEGQPWRCGALGPGERRALEPASAADLDELRREFGGELSPAIGLALERLLAAPGHAWAEAAAPAGVAIASLDAIRWKRDQAWFVTPIAPGEAP